MSFETISLLLNWLELGVLLAILFRLGHTFELIASTQRELRRAIHHLGERRAAELGINNAFGGRIPRGLLAPRIPLLRARLFPTIWPALSPNRGSPPTITGRPTNVPAGLGRFHGSRSRWSVSSAVEARALPPTPQAPLPN